MYLPQGGCSAGAELEAASGAPGGDRGIFQGAPEVGYFGRYLEVQGWL